jgi:HlyD family type I secretion membrane fusion protein
MRPPLLFCAAAIAIGIAIFGIWGGWAPLDSAAIATGQITLSAKRKAIQHLEGGVVEAIWVKEGERVEKEAPLVTLSPTGVDSQLQRVLWQLKAAKVLEKRLIAQEKLTSLSGGSIATRLDFSDSLLANPDESVRQLIKTQEQLFDAKIKEQQAFVSGQQESIKTYQAQIETLEKVLTGVREKLKGFKELYAKNIIPKFGAGVAGLFEVQKELLEMETERTRLKSLISEAEYKILQYKENFRSQTSAEYRENHLHVLEFEQEYRQLKDIADRTVVRAPVAGIVTGLEVHTVGGVVHPGAKLMDIVPQDDELIIEAAVNPQDVESVFPGLKAKIQLNAYKARFIPRLSGEVLSVSADVLHNSPGSSAIQTPGNTYYLVRIRVSETALKRLTLPVVLTPGMPVTVFIVKGSRTLLQYLLSPIRDSFHKAFKEV